MNSKKMQNFICKIFTAIGIIFTFFGLLLLIGCLVKKFCFIKNLELFSGFAGSIIGTLILAFLIMWQIRSTTDSLKMQNQLELRKMFSEEKRWKIHLVIQELKNLAASEFKDNSFEKLKSRCELIDEKIFAAESESNEKPESDSNPFDDEKTKLKKKLTSYLTKHKRELDDYLGLFEVAYAMLDEGLLDEEVFFQSYSYRLSSLESVEYVNTEILNTGSEYWKLLKRLLSKNKKWAYKNKYKGIYEDE